MIKRKVWIAAAVVFFGLSGGNFAYQWLGASPNWDHALELSLFQALAIVSLAMVLSR